MLSVQERGRSSLVVVAEGFRLDGMTEAVTSPGVDRFGRPRLGGIAEVLAPLIEAVSYTHLRAHETVLDLVCRLLLEKKNTMNLNIYASIRLVAETRRQRRRRGRTMT